MPRRIPLALLPAVLLLAGCDDGAKPGAPPAAKAAGDAAKAIGDAVKPTSVPADDGPHSALYGETGGEPILPATTTEPGALMRARKGDSFYQITGATRGQSRFGFPALTIHYNQTSAGEFNGVAVVVRNATGGSRTYLMFGPMDRTGALTLEQDGPGFPGQEPQFSDNMEIFFTRNDPRYGDKSPTFKVSNSFVVGTMPNTTHARNWTDEEARLLSEPPPAYANAGAYPDVGEDTRFAGSDQGGSFRFVDPEGALIGVEYWNGSWDGEDCLARLNPVFTRDQPANGVAKRVVAREGYAVGGLNVKGGKFVYAVQVIFNKLNPDGTLDTADSYTSDWLGPDSSAPETTLGADGRKVIGLHQKAGGVLDGIALVMKSS
jgi:hypothetical protein